MNINDAFATALGMPHAATKPQLGIARSIGSECTARSKWFLLRTRRFWDSSPDRFYGRWKIPAFMLASVLLVASCVGTEQTIDSRNLTLSSAGVSDTQTAEPVTQGEPRNPQPSDPLPDTGGASPPELPHSEPVTHDPTAGVVSPGGTSPGGQHVSLRPKTTSLQTIFSITGDIATAGLCPRACRRRRTQTAMSPIFKHCLRPRGAWARSLPYPAFMMTIPSQCSAGATA